MLKFSFLFRSFVFEKKRTLSPILSLQLAFLDDESAVVGPGGVVLGSQDPERDLFCFSFLESFVLAEHRRN